MALNTPQITPTKKITVRAIGEELPRGDYQRCPQCDMLFSLPEINSHQSAYCPRCQAKIRDGRDWSLTRLAAMAFTMLLLMPFAWGEPLLHIWLLGIRIDANVMQGIWQMTKQGDAITGSMVFFCVIGAPLILVTSIAYLWFGNRLGMNLRPVLLMLERLKEWVMLDIYLVGIGVASIKVQDYAHIQAGVGLFSFVALVILTTVTLSHLNVEELWERFYPQRPATRRDEKLRVCLGCILPAIQISVVAARVAISRYACVAVIVCKMLGGAVSVNRFIVTCQPVAYFYHLSERRTAGRYNSFRNYVAGK